MTGQKGDIRFESKCNDLVVVGNLYGVHNYYVIILPITVSRVGFSPSLRACPSRLLWWGNGRAVERGGGRAGERGGGGG